MAGPTQPTRVRVDYQIARHAADARRPAPAVAGGSGVREVFVASLAAALVVAAAPLAADQAGAGRARPEGVAGVGVAMRPPAGATATAFVPRAGLRR